MSELIFKPKSHTYWVGDRQYPNITSITPTDYSHVPAHRLEIARQRGIDVHKATERYDLDRLGVRKMNWSALETPRGLVVVPYLDAWIKALHDLDIRFAPSAIEKPVYHPVYGFAGTPDRSEAETICYVQGVNSVVELKSVAQLTKETEYQTSGQKCAINYWRRKSGLEPVEDRWAIQLKPNGKYKAVKHEDQTNEPVFLAYLLVMHEEVLRGKRKYPSNGMCE